MYVCLDVGGTEIKAAAIDRQGRLHREISFFPAKAGEEAEVVLDHMADIVRICGVSDAGRHIGEEHNHWKRKGSKVCMAFPGPFDYDRGICLLQGLGKYDKLYGINLRKELAGQLEIREEDILFLNDASAFALGEMRFGEARGAARSLFVCIGTGCGSAFGVEGNMASFGTEGVPEDGYLYPVPFLEGCIDDYLSKRGLMELTRERLGKALDGKALALQVQQGDKEAALCFLAFGERIRDALLPFLDGFRPEILCFGGQIMRSESLFLSPVEEACKERGIKVYVTQDTSLRTLQGLTCIV